MTSGVAGTRPPTPGVIERTALLELALDRDFLHVLDLSCDPDILSDLDLLCDLDLLVDLLRDLELPYECAGDLVSARDLVGTRDLLVPC